MGGFGCPCGHSFKDYEGTSYGARLIADMDFGDFCGAIGTEDYLEPELNAFAYIAANVLQCEKCQRLLVMPKGLADTFVFVPEGHSKNLLGTVKGAAWRRQLFGRWDDRKNTGYVVWGDRSIEGSDSGTELDLKSWEEVQSVYFVIFRRLLTANQLKYARLQRDGSGTVEKAHEFHYGNTLSKRLKHSIAPADLAAGNEWVEVSYGESTSRRGDKKYYSTSLRNKSSKRVRVRKFAGYTLMNGSWVLNTHNKRLYTNAEFMDWYHQPFPWIGPGETVCDNANYGGPPVLWAYHFESDEGDSFVTGNILKQSA